MKGYCVVSIFHTELRFRREVRVPYSALGNVYSPRILQERYTYCDE